MEDYTKAWLPLPVCLVHAVLFETALGTLMIVFRMKHALIIVLLPGFLITFPLAKNVRRQLLLDWSSCQLPHVDLCSRQTNCSDPWIPTIFVSTGQRSIIGNPEVKTWRSANWT
jgi:hypothetical protein